MPTALVLTMRALSSAPLMPDIGRAAHAAVLGWITAADPALGARLHAAAGVRPFTVTGLLEPEGRFARAARVDQRTFLRVTSLSAELDALLLPWNADALGELALGGARWRVEAITGTTDAHRWAGRHSYPQLIEHGMRAAAQGVRRWGMQYVTPLTFRRDGVSQPLPTPDLVFGSLFDRWNAIAPLPMPAELRPRLAELAVSRFALESVVEQTKGKVPQIGAVGNCTYNQLDTAPEMSAWVETLVRFGFYSGAGAGTARGFGMIIPHAS